MDKIIPCHSQGVELHAKFVNGADFLIASMTAYDVPSQFADLNGFEIFFRFDTSTIFIRT